MKKTLLFLPALFFTISTQAQSGVDTVLKKSPVRTLTDQQYNAYLKGIDLSDLAYVAQINHYPLPDKMLQYKKELDLSPGQISGITAIVKQLQMKRLEIGASVIRNERVLDSLFRTNKADDGTIIFYGNRYGLYEGEYRTAVMQACYRTQKLLTERQVKKFEALQKHN
ncbi:MAG: hypothetical protein V4592_26515 [Bacteroidota bacterium]